jgi:chaperonin cofactor prefoldin
MHSLFGLFFFKELHLTKEGDEILKLVGSVIFPVGRANATEMVEKRVVYLTEERFILSV